MPSSPRIIGARSMTNHRVCWPILALRSALVANSDLSGIWEATASHRLFPPPQFCASTGTWAMSKAACLGGTPWPHPHPPACALVAPAGLISADYGECGGAGSESGSSLAALVPGGWPDCGTHAATRYHGPLSFLASEQETQVVAAQKGHFSTAEDAHVGTGGTYRVASMDLD